MQSAVDFFDKQFRAQIRRGDLVLNPFERIALQHARGRVLDCGCGVGNLTRACAERGCDVTAIDASPTAIAFVRDISRKQRLPVTAILGDASTVTVDGPFDTVASIGLLMFQRRDRAFALLARLQALVAKGGVCIVNVLVQGTTYLEMFGTGQRCLFEPEEVRRAFDGWRVLVDEAAGFDAPGGTRKEFLTVVAERT